MKICGIFRYHGVLNKSRGRLLLIIFFVCSFSYIVLPKLLKKFKLPYFTQGDDDFYYAQWNRKTLSKNEILILHWTRLWSEYWPAKNLDADSCSELKSGSLFQAGVKVFNIPCKIISDKRHLDISDALLFHSYDLMWDEVPTKRDAKQLWVYVQLESPIYTKLNLQAYSNVFNWTMTYRRDSDVYHPYGHIVPLPPSLHNNLSATYNKSTPPIMMKSKTRLVAWIVSSCNSHSKREYFVQELQKYLTIDIYGWCGADCPLTYGDCYSHVHDTHKFYLSFENSLCTDYITEKFFNALNSNMVPVVYGGAQAQDYIALAPKDSFIDARSFNSPKDLANYLLYLDKNDEEYLKYFEWKKHYKVGNSNVGWCNLCQRVYQHLQVQPSDRKWFQDLWKWWNYMSYDTNVEIDEHQATPSHTATIRQSYNFKLGAPACISPLQKFTEGSKTKPDFGPGILNGRIFGKLIRWAKENVS